METRPGQTIDVASAAVDVVHAAPVVETLGTGTQFVGVAIKTKQEGPDVGYGNAQNKTVKAGEKYKIQVKGRVYVANSKQEGGAFIKGDAVYIIPTAGGTKNLLTATSASNKKFGVVTEIAGERGVGTGFMRVDLDLKDSF